MNDVVAVIAAHPDDEVLGCGATIARHVQQGDTVHVLFLSRGTGSRQGSNEYQLTELRDRANRACAVMGVASTTFEDFPDCRLDSVDRLDLIRTVEAFIRSFGPGIVYTHLPIDLNIDHVRVNESVVTACRPLPNSTVKRLLCFEIPSSTGWRAGLPAFAPNWFVEVSATFELKLEALRQYGDEIRPFPHARSVEAVTALARWRGASVGVEMAEAFTVALNIM